jgi:hypothetical protein
MKDYAPGKDFEWFVNADLSEYRGEYVIIYEEKVVLHGENPVEMIGEFKSMYAGAIPTMAKVPKQEVLVLTDIE